MSLSYNTCDKCKQRHISDDLVWITALDFQPFGGEVVPPALYKKYDALCELCYAASIDILPN
jgi:hypothetical protein